MLFSVIPAKAGIQHFHLLQITWAPAFAGVTTCYDVIKIPRDDSSKIDTGIAAGGCAGILFSEIPSGLTGRWTGRKRKKQAEN